MDENEPGMKIKCLISDNGENLLPMNSMNSVKIMEVRDYFHLQKLLNRMGLLKGKT